MVYWWGVGVGGGASLHVGLFWKREYHSQSFLARDRKVYISPA